MSDSHIGAAIAGTLAVSFILVAVLIGMGVLSVPAIQDDDVPEEYTIVTVYIDDSGTHYILEDQDGVQWMLTQYGTTVTLVEMTEVGT